MEKLKFTRDIAQLAVLQRIELANQFLMRIRKLFGRYLFSKIFFKIFDRYDKGIRKIFQTYK